MLRKNKQLIVYISFVIFSIISVILLSRTKVLYSAGDLHFHLRRVLELSSSILHGNVHPLFLFNYGHGSLVMGMYPYISIVPFSILLIITHSMIASYYLFIMLTIFSSFAVSFLSSLRFSKSIVISYLFSVIYGMSSPFVFNAFITGDLGVITSLVFVPLAIFGFIDILYNSNNYMKFVLGITGLLFCQIPSTVIIFLFVILWMRL